MTDNRRRFFRRAQIRSAVFYEGKSQLTGDPIVGIVTGLSTIQPSINSKTGEMAQAYILRSDVSPTEAVLSGGDRAICGDCRHRSPNDHDRNIGRSCYVIWWQAPQKVWTAYKQGAITRVAATILEQSMHGNHIRLGAYGDPAAIPYRYWLPILRGTSGAIGYTSQWRMCDPMFARICMASVNNAQEAQQAQALGWRTYRVRPIGGELFENECVCPASEEADHSATCRECQLCQGTARQAKNVAIVVHGNRVKWFQPESRA